MTFNECVGQWSSQEGLVDYHEGMRNGNVDFKAWLEEASTAEFGEEKPIRIAKQIHEEIGYKQSVLILIGRWCKLMASGGILPHKLTKVCSLIGKGENRGIGDEIEALKLMEGMQAERVEAITRVFFVIFDIYGRLYQLPPAYKAAFDSVVAEYAFDWYAYI